MHSSTRAWLVRNPQVRTCGNYHATFPEYHCQLPPHRGLHRLPIGRIPAAPQPRPRPGRLRRRMACGVARPAWRGREPRGQARETTSRSEERSKSIPNGRRRCYRLPCHRQTRQVAVSSHVGRLSVTWARCSGPRQLPRAISARDSDWAPEFFRARGRAGGGPAVTAQTVTDAGPAGRACCTTRVAVSITPIPSGRRCHLAAAARVRAVNAPLRRLLSPVPARQRLRGIPHAER